MLILHAGAKGKGSVLKSRIDDPRGLIKWLGNDRGIPAAVEAAKSISRAVTAALADPKSRTGDIRGTGNTASMTAAIVKGIRTA